MSLRNELFKDKENIYKKLAFDLNGNFSHGDFTNPVRVSVPYKNWTIVADTFVVMELINTSSGNPYGGNSEHTRIRVPFIRKQNFTFAITTANALDSFAKFFGSQDITVDDEQFDNQFIIKGSDKSNVKLLFSNPSVKKSLSEMNDVNLVLRNQEGFLGTPLPENINELFFKAGDVIMDENELKSLIHLFEALLDELCHLGCIDEREPDFKLV
jgi:hypothetical protein